jgi:type II secretory pathway pseudopilin PulG
VAYCASCGASIGDEDVFCRVCGKSVKPPSSAPEEAATGVAAATVDVGSEAAEGEAPAPASEEPAAVAATSMDAANPPSPGSGVEAAPKRKARRWLIPVIALVVIVAIAVAVVLLVNKKSADDKAAKAAAQKAHIAAIAAQKGAATKALAPFQKLDSALSVGVNFDEYGRYVRDAKYASDSYNPTDPTGKQIEKSLVKSAKLYAAANDAWNDDIQMKFTGDKQTSYYWTNHYGGLAGQLKSGSVTAKNVEQAAWAAASLEVAVAAVTINAYDKQK